VGARGKLLGASTAPREDVNLHSYQCGLRLGRQSGRLAGRGIGHGRSVCASQDLLVPNKIPRVGRIARRR
jgi:hypothetical protein